MSISLDSTILRHPTRHQLVAHAESLVDRGSPVSAAMAAHLSACPRCAAEVRAIRASLEFTASVPVSEPPSGLARQILEGAREARRVSEPAPRRAPARSLLAGALRGAVFTALTAATAALVFTSALGEPSGGQDSPPAGNLPKRAALAVEERPAPPENIRDRAREIGRLSASVARLSAEPRTPREWERRRTLEGVSQDMNAALAALERNPGCPRANELVRTHLDRQAESLRDLFIERTL